MTSMPTCKLLTTKGRPCAGLDAGRGLCANHDPDGQYLRQRPVARARVLARADVLAVLGVTPVLANHCSTCACVVRSA